MNKIKRLLNVVIIFLRSCKLGFFFIFFVFTLWTFLAKEKKIKIRRKMILLKNDGSKKLVYLLVLEISKL